MLELNPVLMMFVLVIFFSLLYLLNQMLYEPLLKFMDDRENSIANDLKNAKEMSNSSDEINAKADAVIADARAEAHAVKEKAINDAKSLAEDKIDTKNKELNAKYESFMEGLSKDRMELENSLLNDLSLFKDGLKNKMGSL